MTTQLSTTPVVPDSTSRVEARRADRFAILDGWRATSILLVLVGHLFPLGPHRWGLNEAIPSTGMVLFFILSGFLITRSLASGADLRVFVIRRLARIVPLSWAVMLVLLIADRSEPAAWSANLLFYANLPPQHLLVGGTHLWSLCVEMQFYAGIALFVAVAGASALRLLPLLCFAVTGLRIVEHYYIGIVTWYRVDEILAGGILALVSMGLLGELPRRALVWLNPLWLMPLLIASAHPETGAWQYLRPYLAALTIGSSMYGAPRALTVLFENRVAGYIAQSSYALYIFHGALRDTWLGSGDTFFRYLKRPLLLVVTFFLSHLSTFKFELPLVEYAKRMTRGAPVRVG